MSCEVCRALCEDNDWTVFGRIGELSDLCERHTKAQNELGADDE